jgi:hypothetical protein
MSLSSPQVLLHPFQSQHRWREGVLAGSMALACVASVANCLTFFATNHAWEAPTRGVGMVGASRHPGPSGLAAPAHALSWSVLTLACALLAAAFVGLVVWVWQASDPKGSATPLRLTSPPSQLAGPGAAPTALGSTPQQGSGFLLKNPMHVATAIELGPLRLPSTGHGDRVSGASAALRGGKSRQSHGPTMTRASGRPSTRSPVGAGGTLGTAAAAGTDRVQYNMYNTIARVHGAPGSRPGPLHLSPQALQILPAPGGVPGGRDDEAGDAV